jgi:hypothetical protein
MPPKPTDSTVERKRPSLRWLALLRRKRQDAAKPARGLTSDVLVAGMGVGLGLVCALFPWYIFLHQDKFGISSIKFSEMIPKGTPGLGEGPLRIGAIWKLPDRKDAGLDGFPTGTVAKASNPSDAEADQPYPGDKAAPFNLVQVANGQALIEDADGFFVVRVGSPLPDDSRVRSIEERDGEWVLVTSADKVVRLSGE